MNDKEKNILKKELYDIAKIWQHQLHLEYVDPNKNVRISFKDIGSFGELLAISYNTGYVGSGSGGMGLDLLNRTTKKSIEVKTCCTIQNSKCKNKKCGAKFNPLFHMKCPVCDNNGKEMSDSRFSINAKEFLGQYDLGKFDNFTLCHIYEFSHDKNNKKFTLKLDLYKIDFNDENTKSEKLNYFKEQNKSGKKQTCNLLPLSFDFYKLCPILIDTFYIELNYDDMSKTPFIKNEKLIKDIRVPISVFKKNEKEQQEIFQKLPSYCSKDKTANMIDFTINIPYRKKTHGKNRGDTRKNAYRAIT